MEFLIKEACDITYPDRLFQSSRDPESVEYYIGICPNLPRPFDKAGNKCITSQKGGVNSRKITYVASIKKSMLRKLCAH